MIKSISTIFFHLFHLSTSCKLRLGLLGSRIKKDTKQTIPKQIVQNIEMAENEQKVQNWKNIQIKKLKKSSRL